MFWLNKKIYNAGTGAPKNGLNDKTVIKELQCRKQELDTESSKLSYNYEKAIKLMSNNDAESIKFIKSVNNTVKDFNQKYSVFLQDCQAAGVEYEDLL
jgi:hypothetical protein